MAGFDPLIEGRVRLPRAGGICPVSSLAVSHSSSSLSRSSRSDGICPFSPFLVSETTVTLPFVSVSMPYQSRSGAPVSQSVRYSQLSPSVAL